MPVTVLREGITLRLRVPLEASRSEHGLSAALDALLSTTKMLPRPLLPDGGHDAASFLVVTFHTPERRWVSERRFFERCAKHPKLAPKVVAYVEHVNPRCWEKDPFYGAGFWTSTMAPAGSLAIVPLALRDPAYLPALADHLRGSDVDHETFHRALVTELVRRHGLAEPVLDLIALRAVDAAGQFGCADLRWLSTKTPFGEQIAGEAGLAAFAERVHRVSQRPVDKYRALYVSNAGKALFADDASRFARWLAAFEAKGLSFDESERKLDKQHDPHAPPSFEKTWEECASCDETG